MPGVETHETTENHAALPAAKAQKMLPASTGPTPVKGSFPWRKIVLVLVLLGIAALIWYKVENNKKATAAEDAKAAQAANRPIPVSVSPVQSKTMPIYLTELGTVTAYNTVTVKSRVDGQLLSVNVREGQQVRAGQLLAQIDPRPYLAVQAQAEGQLAKDIASADFSKAEAGRYTALYEAGVISKESQQTQVSNAGASMGTLAADRAAIQAAKVNVAYTRITSPINGVVGLRQVDAGNIVHAADTTGLLVVTQLQPIAVIFSLPEEQLPQVLQLIRQGHKLVVDAFDRSETTHLASGVLLTVDNQIDTTTGTVKAKAVFNNTDGALFPNQFVNVRLILEQRAGSLVVPSAAIQTGNDGSFVYVARPCPASGCPQPDNSGSSKAAKSPGSSPKTDEPASSKPKGQQYYADVANVVVDLTEGSQTILKSGVSAGDKVVIDGEEKLKKNSPVIPKAGHSNAGGPATQTIGSLGPDSSQSPEPAPATPKQQGRSSGTQGAGGGRN
jgi:multidrug efflux system membrane fusion protein